MISQTQGFQLLRFNVTILYIAIFLQRKVFEDVIWINLQVNTYDSCDAGVSGADLETKTHHFTIHDLCSRETLLKVY